MNLLQTFKDRVYKHICLVALNKDKLEHFWIITKIDDNTTIISNEN